MVHACQTQGHTQSLCGHSARLRIQTGAWRVARLHRHLSRWRNPIMRKGTMRKSTPLAKKLQEEAKGQATEYALVCMHGIEHAKRPTDAFLQILESKGQSMRHAFTATFPFAANAQLNNITTRSRKSLYLPHVRQSGKVPRYGTCAVCIVRYSTS